MSSCRDQHARLGVGRHPYPSPLLTPAAAKEHAAAPGETTKVGDQLQDSKGSVQELLEALPAAQDLSESAADCPCAHCGLFQPGQRQEEKSIWHKRTLFLPPLLFPWAFTLAAQGQSINSYSPTQFLPPFWVQQ